MMRLLLALLPKTLFIALLCLLLISSNNNTSTVLLRICTFIIHFYKINLLLADSKVKSFRWREGIIKPETTTISRD